MAHGQFKHANSPSELAKREAEGAGVERERPRGFMHYNHPDEVARRERAERGEKPPPPPQQQRGAASALPPVLPALPPVPPAAAVSVVPAPRIELPRLSDLPQADAQQRPSALQRLALVEEFLSSLGDLGELRVLLQNLPTLQETVLSNVNRIRALESTLDDLYDDDGKPGDDEAPPPPSEG